MIEEFIEITDEGETVRVRGQFVLKGLKLCKHNLGENCPLCKSLLKGGEKGNE